MVANATFIVDGAYAPRRAVEELDPARRKVSNIGQPEKRALNPGDGGSAARRTANEMRG